MKLVFLDFDGVLTNANSFRKASGYNAPADPPCVTALNRITDKCGAQIVVSSAWLVSYPRPVESFVILDDNQDMVHLAHRLVRTQFSAGLTEADAEVAIRILES